MEKLKLLFSNKKTAFFILRLGLTIVLLYAGISMLIDSTPWIGFVPMWLVGILIKIGLPVELFLAAHAIFEIILALWILSGWHIRWAGLVLFLDMLSILIFYGIDLVTFRDIGLLGAALFLSLYSTQENQNPL